jgi:hypothetical protein
MALNNSIILIIFHPVKPKEPSVNGKRQRTQDLHGGNIVKKKGQQMKPCHPLKILVGGNGIEPSASGM